MSFELFLVRDNGGPWDKLMRVNINEQPFRDNEIEFAILHCEEPLGKPFSLRLYTCSVYENIIQAYTLDPPVPARIPFKQDMCVICTVNKPDILYLSCGHLCICDSCDKMQPINTCPLCRKECVNKFYLGPS